MAPEVEINLGIWLGLFTLAILLAVGVSLVWTAVQSWREGKQHEVLNVDQWIIDSSRRAVSEWCKREPWGDEGGNTSTIPEGPKPTDTLGKPDA